MIRVVANVSCGGDSVLFSVVDPGYFVPRFLLINIDNYNIFIKNKDKKHKISNLLRLLLNILSNFTYELNTNIVELNYAHVQRLLEYFANSPLTPYIYIAGVTFNTSSRVEISASGKIAGIHRMLKTPTPSLPIDLVIGHDNPTVDPCRSNNARIAAALMVPGLVTSTSRRGGELRQVLAQTLLALFHATGDDEVFNALRVLVKDTYSNYADRVARSTEALVSELRHLAVRINKNECLGNLLSGCIWSERRSSPTFSDYVRNIFECVKRSGNRLEFLFGRINYILNKIKSNNINVDVVVTVATGQWSVGQLKAIADKVQVDKFVVLYTPNTFDLRLLEETLRNEAGVQNLSVMYIPVSATDPLVIDAGIRVALDKAREKASTGKILVLAQGPSTISVPLYIAAKNSGYESLII